ncbi:MULTISPECIES: DUF488 domain-containing protein [unclassified Beijerinckia]|uniref:DUF488 domain-containing protein n=1 Tax=unclassified Beijerinckia TaxID=2638183 RepID=UPI00089603FE|nr:MULTISPECIES: DUF488 domain-containing protein [unclassified Beijerinckia]SED92486.1 Uncharacterized conserved protein YeaO, DUF488 family [Beijerinckia sp. 28-YEA-48]
MPPQIQIKRVYEPKSPTDGIRVLVDRLWPRGLRKENASLDFWLKDIAPSTALRKWYNHDPKRWPEFKDRYKHEISQSPDKLTLLAELISKGQVTLLYAAHDGQHSNAEALRQYLISSRNRISHK